MTVQPDLAIDIGVAMQKLNRQLARVDSDFQKAALRQERAFIKANDKIAKDFDRLASQANKSMSQIQLPGLGGIGGALAGFVSARELVRMTDTWTDLSSRIGIAVRDMDKAPEVMARISDMARRTYSSVELSAESFLANSTALRELGMTTSQSLDFTEALNNALVVSGAKADRAASVQNALAKAMALGVLSGDDLNTVIQSGGKVAELLAAELGVNVNQLRKIGSEGKLTGQVIDRALRGNLAELRAEAESMPATISDGFLLLRNAVLQYVGTADQSIEASGRVAAAMVFLADNIDLVVAAGGVLAGRVLGPAMLSLLTGLAATLRTAATAMGATASAAGRATAALTGLRAALAFVGGPVGLVLAGLTALPLVTTSAAERVDRLQGASRDAADALDTFAEASKRAKDEQDQLGGSMTAATEQMLTQSRAALQAARDQLRREIADAEKDALGGGLNPLNTSEVNSVRSDFLLSARKYGGVFQELVDLMDQVESGQRSLGSVSGRLEQIAGAGDEATEAVAEFRKAVSDGRSTDAAQRQLIRLATAMGGFDQQLARVRAAAGTAGAAGAYDDLALAMEMTAAAGSSLRDSGAADRLRDNASAADSASLALQATEEALRDNVEAAQTLMEQGNPLRAVEEGANTARTAVVSLKEAMEALPSEIKTRVSGLEGASDGVTASAALLRQFEGTGGKFSETAYPDMTRRDGQWVNSAYRIGFGSDTVTLADGTIQKVTQGMRISAEDANRDLTRRVVEFQNTIRGQIGSDTFGTFTPAQQAALTSIAYNYGDLPDRLVAAIRSGNNDSIVTAIASLQGHNDGINKDRRLAEASIFAGGVGVESAAQRQEAEAARAVADAERDAKDAAKEHADKLKEAVEARADLLSAAQRQVEDQQFELNLIGKTASEQAKLRAQYLMTNEARANGIILTEQIAGSEQTYGEAIEQNAARIGEYVAAQERRAKSENDAAARLQFMEQVQQNLKDGILDSILAGNSFAETLANIAKMLARAALEAALFGSGPFSKPGGGQGLLGPVMSAVFGGFRAKGGPVSPSKAYVVGERGPEVFQPKVPGSIIPNHALGRGSSSFVFAPNVHLGGSATQEDVAMLRAELARERAMFASKVQSSINEFQTRSEI